MGDETQRLANELADARQKHQVTQDQQKHQITQKREVPSTANPSPLPFPIRKKDLTLYHSPNSQNEQQGVDLTTAWTEHENTVNELAATQMSLSEATVRLKPTSRTHPPKY